ncbi:MAG: hypothetical protein V4649_00050 [Bacteroidota bacterium]
MRYLSTLLLVLIICSGDVHAYGRKDKRGLPRTEAGLMDNIVGCLQNRDTIGYYNLFIPFDTLWGLVLHNADRTPEAQGALNVLKEHPQTLLEFDPRYNRAIIDRFNMVIQKGIDSGIHWNAVKMQRYELKKQAITTTRLAAYNLLAPERFQGYMFIRDMLGRTNYCVSITEIQKVNGYFYGGQVVNMLPASSIDEFLGNEDKERRYIAWLAEHPVVDTPVADSAKNDSLKKADALGIAVEDDENKSIKREVVDRKYYEGSFDEEIQVRLYVRYMKEPGPGKPVAYDGLYKFGDQKSYVRLDITRTADGKWLMEDDIPVGVLELVLKERTYTGVWTNSDQNGFDVVLKQTGVPQKKVEALDNILDRGFSGRLDEESFTTDTAAAKGAAAGKEKDKEKTKKKDKDEEPEAEKEDKPRKEKAPKKDKVTKKRDKALKKEMRKRRRRLDDE